MRDGSHHAKQLGLWCLLAVMVLLYYRLQWGTPRHLSKAIDQMSFMQDFVEYYYPTSRRIFEASTPVPGYYYSSFFALALAPISALPPSVAMLVWGVIQLVSLAAFCVVSARLLMLSPTGTALYAGLVATSFPILHNLKWGQVSVPLTVCVTAACLAANRHKQALAGMLLALAAAVKFYPVAFAVYFLTRRNGRALLWFGLVAFVCYIALPVTLLGFSKWLAFETAVQMGIRGDDTFSHDLNSQYVVHVGLRWFERQFGRPAGPAAADLLTLVGYVIAVSCVGMMWFLRRRGSCKKDAAAVAVMFLAVPFVLKTSWPHYFVYLPFCQAAVLAWYASSGQSWGWRGRVLSGLPCVSMLLSSVFGFSLFPDWQAYNAWGTLFVANLLLLLAMYAAVGLEAGRPDRATAGTGA
jgi:alpha-1,2-mannosyltransferase